MLEVLSLRNWSNTDTSDAMASILTLTIRGLSWDVGRNPIGKMTWATSGGPRVKTPEHHEKEQVEI